jgi:hypothetical protein
MILNAYLVESFKDMVFENIRRSISCDVTPYLEIL